MQPDEHKEMSEMNDRVIALERGMVGLHNVVQAEVDGVRKDLQIVIERHSNVLERLLEKMQTAIDFQKNSLPIGLVMKLFSFFSLLIISLLAAILGIKWLALSSGAL